MPAPDAISCDKLAKLIGTPKAPVILDVRRAALRDEDPRAIPAARQTDAPPSKIPAMVSTGSTFTGMPTSARANKGVPPIA